MIKPFPIILVLLLACQYYAIGYQAGGMNAENEAYTGNHIVGMGDDLFQERLSEARDRFNMFWGEFLHSQEYKKALSDYVASLNLAEDITQDRVAECSRLLNELFSKHRDAWISRHRAKLATAGSTVKLTALVNGEGWVAFQGTIREIDDSSVTLALRDRVRIIPLNCIAPQQLRFFSKAKNEEYNSTICNAFDSLIRKHGYEKQEIERLELALKEYDRDITFQLGQMHGASENEFVHSGELIKSEARKAEAEAAIQDLRESQAFFQSLHDILSSFGLIDVSDVDGKVRDSGLVYTHSFDLGIGMLRITAIGGSSLREAYNAYLSKGPDFEEQWLKTCFITWLGDDLKVYCRDGKWYAFSVEDDAQLLRKLDDKWRILDGSTPFSSPVVSKDKAISNEDGGMGKSNRNAGPLAKAVGKNDTSFHPEKKLSAGLEAGLVFSSGELSSNRELVFDYQVNGFTCMFIISGDSSEDAHELQLDCLGGQVTTRWNSDTVEIRSEMDTRRHGGSSFNSFAIEESNAHAFLVSASSNDIRVYVDGRLTGICPGSGFYENTRVRRVVSNTSSIANFLLWNRSLSRTEVYEAFRQLSDTKEEQMPLIAPFYHITRPPKEVVTNNAANKQIEKSNTKTSPGSRLTVDAHGVKGGRFQGLPLELNIANDGVWDGMCSKEYIGVYYLNTTGQNAGYYVNKTGNVRFPSSPSRSTMICSSSYRVYFEGFPFASEIETGGGNRFFKRDDFIFCKNNSIKSASFCGTKFSIRNGNMRGIGSVRTAKLLYTGKDEQGDEGGIGSVGTAKQETAGNEKEHAERGIGSVGTAKQETAGNEKEHAERGIGSAGTAKHFPGISPRISSWVTLFLW